MSPMQAASIACARCASGNHPSSRFCERCGLAIGSAQSDAGVVLDLFGGPETLEEQEAGLDRAIRGFAERSGFELCPYGIGWCLIVTLPIDRKQAVYLGPAGHDAEGRGLVGLVSVCGSANDRDARRLLSQNARAVDCHFAIRVLRGEEYFVVCRTLTIDALDRLEAPGLIRRIASYADGLEDRLTRGLDLF